MSCVACLNPKLKDATPSWPPIKILFLPKPFDCKWGANRFFFKCCIEVASPDCETRVSNSCDVKYHCSLLQCAASSQHLMEIMLGPNHYNLISKIFGVSRFFIIGHESAAFPIL
jgi:hypothetical protein